MYSIKVYELEQPLPTWMASQSAPESKKKAAACSNLCFPSKEYAFFSAALRQRSWRKSLAKNEDILVSLTVLKIYVKVRLWVTAFTALAAYCENSQCSLLGWISCVQFYNLFGYNGKLMRWEKLSFCCEFLLSFLEVKKPFVWYTPKKLLFFFLLLLLFIIITIVTYNYYYYYYLSFIIVINIITIVTIAVRE